MAEQSYNLKYTGKEIDDLLDKANDMNSSAQVPTGGSSGQVLTKKSDTDFDAEWETPGTTLPSGGTADQILTKNSATDGDASWKTPETPSNPLPTGGAVGQALVKNSSTDYDVKWTTIDGSSGGAPLIIETNAVESLDDNTITSTVLTADEIKTLLSNNSNTIFLTVYNTAKELTYSFIMQVTNEAEWTSISGFFQPGYDETSLRQPVWIVKLDLTKDTDNVTFYYQQNAFACKVFPMISTGTSGYYKADGWTFDDLRAAVSYLVNYAVIRIADLGIPLFLKSFSNLNSDTNASITFNSQLTYYRNTTTKVQYPTYYAITITPSTYTNAKRNYFNFSCGYIPDGGTTGQILAKYSSNDYATQWIDLPTPDKTLTQDGVPADAKATGEKIASLLKLVQSPEVAISNTQDSVLIDFSESIPDGYKPLAVFAARTLGFTGGPYIESWASPNTKCTIWLTTRGTGKVALSILCIKTD